MDTPDLGSVDAFAPLASDDVISEYLRNAWEDPDPIVFFRAVAHVSRIRGLPWQTRPATAPIEPNRYRTAVAFLIRILDTIGEDSQHPLVGLATLVTGFVRTYEERNIRPAGDFGSRAVSNA